MFPPDYFPAGSRYVTGIGTLGVDGGVLKYTDGTRVYRLSAQPELRPDALTGLRLWLRADAGLYQDAAGTIAATAAGAPVGRWADQSPFANHATQATAAARPALRTALINGKPAVQFDGATSLLNLASRVTTARTIVAVMRWTNTTTEYLPMLGDSSLYYFHGSGSGCGGTAAGLLGPSCANAALTGGSGFVNGVTTAPSAIARPTAFQVVSLLTTDVVQFNNIAQDRTFNRFFAGYYAELAVFDTPLADADRRGVELYLASKYGLY